MCLQWCHVAHQLIDNDFPCAHCPPERRFAHTGRTCAACRHFVAAARLCTLTHEDVPGSACCHYDILPDSGQRFVRREDVAMGLLERYGVAEVAGLFERSETAPECEPQGEGAWVELADLAVPEVYGLPADEWDAALRRPLDWDALPWPENMEEEA